MKKTDEWAGSTERRVLQALSYLCFAMGLIFGALLVAVGMGWMDV